MKFYREVAITDDAGTTHEFPRAILEQARGILDRLGWTRSYERRVELLAIELHKCFDDGYA